MPLNLPAIDPEKDIWGQQLNDNLTYLDGKPSGGIPTGTGSPEGVVTASPGSFYSDATAARGVVLWRKATGTGSTGWVVSQGDTGWRDITSTVDAAKWNNVSTSTNIIKIRRINTAVYLDVYINRTLGSGSRRSGSEGVIFPAPTGFLTRCTGYTGNLATGSDYLTVNIQNFSTDFRALASGTWIAGDSVRFAFSGTTTDSWPTTMPGTPA